MHYDMNKIQHKLSSIWQRFSFKKPTFSNQFMRYYLQHKGIVIVAGIIVAVLCYKFIAWHLQSFAFVNPRIFSSQANDYWAKQDQFYYDPINIVTYADNATIVDIRSKESFETEHINTSVNIPVELDKSGKISNKKEILDSFSKLDHKRIIVIYGDNTYSLLVIKAAAFLNQKGIPVKVMTIGWNEFRHLTNFWLPERLWNKVNIIDFVETNK